MPTAVMLTRGGTERPYWNASSVLNGYFASALGQEGYSIESLMLPPVAGDDPWIPSWAMESYRRLRRRPEVDLAVFCDVCQSMEPLDLVKAARTIFFFHGLVMTPMVWLHRRPDVLCANSTWTGEMLKAISGSPLWSEKSCLSPHALQRVVSLRFPLPALDEPSGRGGSAPELAPIFETLQRGQTIYGVDFQYEADDRLHGSILLMLNVIAKQEGSPWRFRLVAPQIKALTFEEEIGKLDGDQQRRISGVLRLLGMSLQDLYLPISSFPIPQFDLFRLMKGAGFSLSFNRIPESFGLMPLESVMNGCPVFTNGAGNLRFLLPENHGVFIEDTFGLADYDSEEIARVARKIYDVAVRSRSQSRDVVQESLAAGQQYIRTHYSRAAFARSFSEMLHGSPRQTRVESDGTLQLSVAVRRWDRSSGRMLTDMGDRRLTQEQNRGLDRLLGRSSARLFADASVDEQDLVSHLWDQGFLSWADPD